MVGSFRWDSAVVVDEALEIEHEVHQLERQDDWYTGSWDDHRLERRDGRCAGSWVVLQQASKDAYEQETGVVHSWVSSVTPGDG